MIKDMTTKMIIENILALGISINIQTESFFQIQLCLNNSTFTTSWVFVLCVWFLTLMYNMMEQENTEIPPEHLCYIEIC